MTVAYLLEYHIEVNSINAMNKMTWNACRLGSFIEWNFWITILSSLKRLHILNEIFNLFINLRTYKHITYTMKIFFTHTTISPVYWHHTFSIPHTNTLNVKWKERARNENWKTWTTTTITELYQNSYTPFVIWIRIFWHEITYFNVFRFYFLFYIHLICLYYNKI